MTSDNRNLTIRAAKDSDLDWIDAREKSSPRNMLEKQIRDGEAIIAETAEERVGLLRFQYVWLTRPFIASVSVAEPHRRKGIAKTLLAFFENYHRERGYEYILSSTMPNNPLGQAWHMNSGFHECGYWAGIDQNGVGEIFYRKEL